MNPVRLDLTETERDVLRVFLEMTEPPSDANASRALDSVRQKLALDALRAADVKRRLLERSSR